MMDKKERAIKILELLDIHYPFSSKCYLDYAEPYQLMIATILSAQCTDDRVNMVTKDLFQKYPTLEAFADAELTDMEAAIRSAGFYRVKAKNIIEASRLLFEKYNGVMPSDIGELTAFPGVGRKTANVIRGYIFQIPSIVVDTHVKRITKKLGLTDSDDPTKIEFELMDILPEDGWIKYNAQVIAHGRKTCTARSPKCGDCFLYDLCVWKDAKQG